MKKVYIAPESQAISLNLESIIAMSLTVDKDTELGGGDSYSNHKGWSSEAWTTTEEEF